MLDDLKNRLSVCLSLQDEEEKLRLLKTIKSDILTLLFQEKRKNIQQELIDMIKKSSLN